MKKAIIITLFMAVAFSSIVNVIQNLGKLQELEDFTKFEEFKFKYNRQYESPQEHLEKFAIFQENLRKIEALNEDGGATYAINDFSDVSEEEFKRTHRNYRSSGIEREELVLDEDFIASGSVDWRSKGAVAKVKNQGSCGSCWAFGTISAIEGQYQINGHALTSFSEQQLVSCDYSKQGNAGCDGGLQEDAFDYLKTHGFVSQSDYPYTSGRGKRAKCKSSGLKAYGFVKSWKSIRSKDESALAQAVAQQGPITIAVNADLYQNYDSGIMKLPRGKTCKGGMNDLDHAVTIVGYGSEGGVDYWIVKNSWGTGWGERGYVRMQRGINLCGCATDALSMTLK